VELLHRMKGWFTADVYKTADIVKEYGELRLLDDYNLVIEVKDMKALEDLSRRLTKEFGEEVWIEHMVKKSL
jgi:hypothetical protein